MIHYSFDLDISGYLDDIKKLADELNAVVIQSTEVDILSKETYRESLFTLSENYPVIAVLPTRSLTNVLNYATSMTKNNLVLYPGAHDKKSPVKDRIVEELLELLWKTVIMGVIEDLLLHTRRAIKGKIFGH